MPSEENHCENGYLPGYYFRYKSKPCKDDLALDAFTSNTQIECGKEEIVKEQLDQSSEVHQRSVDEQRSIDNILKKKKTERRDSGSCD